MRADGTISSSAPTPGRSGSLRHQEGFFRGAIVVFVVVTIVGVFILDILSVYTAHQTLSQQTRSAAIEAATSYVNLGSEPAAELAARQYLADHGSALVKIVADHTAGLNDYTVTAKRTAKTYFFRYLAKLPKVGGWIDRQLHPMVTGDNSQ